MGKLTSLVLLLSLVSFDVKAYVENFEVFFQNDLEEIEKSLALSVLKNKSVFSHLSQEDRFSAIEKDPKDRITSDFRIRPFFREGTEFWFNVYTAYSTQNAVLHDRERLGIVYTVLDYSELHQSALNRQTVQALQNQFTESKIAQIRSGLSQLAQGEEVSQELISLIHKAVENSPHELPDAKNERRKLYLSLAENLRAQTGQRDNIKQGLVNYQPFKDVIESYIAAFKLPSEVLALSFLESSFNTRAKSRVGATGVWQFMRFISNSFMVVNDHRDDRLNPLISSVSALFLLQENRQILRRWDLAIVAYNSGTRHLINARRTLELPNMSLEDYFTRYDHPHVGFASRNFFSGFLALVHTLAYKDQFFNAEIITQRAKSNPINHENLSAYVSRCPIEPNWFFNALKDSSPAIESLNAHLLEPNRTYPRGTILYSDVDLTSKRYVKVPIDRIPHNRPKDWKRFVRNHSCSTR